MSNRIKKELENRYFEITGKYVPDWVLEYLYGTMKKKYVWVYKTPELQYLINKKSPKELFFLQSYPS